MAASTQLQPSRWWEGYVIRYSVGTVVGGIVFSILCSVNDSLRPFLFGASPEKFETSHIILLGAYGFAYCYLSSAPILVFHTSRWMLKTKLNLDELLLKLLITLSIPLIVAQALYDRFQISDGASHELLRFSAFILAYFVWLQILAIARNVTDHEGLLAFYTELAKKRDSSSAQLIESYRHLREHGNAYFVVFLEVAFALVLQSAGDLIRAESSTVSPERIAFAYVIVVLLWAGPAVAIWLVGNSIERKLVEHDGP